MNKNNISVYRDNIITKLNKETLNWIIVKRVFNSGVETPNRIWLEPKPINTSEMRLELSVIDYNKFQFTNTMNHPLVHIPISKILTFEEVLIQLVV